MTAILFGSISTLADTSELQRGAFNDAFREHGLDWNWEREPYQAMLTIIGGKNRIEAEAKRLGVEVDAAAIHATKSKRAQEMLKGIRLSPRPGVVETVREAKARGWKVGLVTTTALANVDSIFDAASNTLDRDDFDIVLSVESVDKPKPDPAVYTHALQQLGVSTGETVAIEDNVGGVAAAKSAGVPVIAFPNENTVTHDFGDVETVYTQKLADLTSRTGADAR